MRKRCKTGLEGCRRQRESEGLQAQGAVTRAKASTVLQLGSSTASSSYDTPSCTGVGDRRWRPSLPGSEIGRRASKQGVGNDKTVRALEGLIWHTH